MEVTRPDTDSRLLNYPKASFYRLCQECLYHLLHCAQDSLSILPSRVKHNDSRMLLRWIEANIGESQVQRDESSLFLHASLI